MMDDSTSEAPTYEPRSYDIDEYSDAGRRGAAPLSLTDLSYRFDRHTISSRRPSIGRDTASAHPALARHPLSDPAEQSHRHLYTQRPRLKPRQTSPTISSRMASTADGLVARSQQNRETHHRSSFSDSITSPSLSPDELPAMKSSYFHFAHQTAAAAGPETPSPDSSELFFGPEAYVVGRDLRHSLSRGNIGIHQKVQKPIRMRRRPQRGLGSKEKN